jgi:fatty acid-binding protein DegV
MQFVGNKLTYYKTVNNKNEVYKTEATSPQELLEILRATAPQAPAEDNGKAMENVDKAAKSSTETGNFAGLGSVTVDPEEAKKNFQKLLAAKKNVKKEIEERKKEDDAGCDSPL